MAGPENRARGIYPTAPSQTYGQEYTTYTPPPPGADTSQTRERQLPSGKYITEVFDDTTGSWVPVGNPYEGVKDSAGGAGRNDALSAAQAALSGFLQAQSLADARKLAAMEQFQKLGQWAVPQGAQFAPNFEPGGLANTAYAVAGMPRYTPPPLQTAQVNPGDTKGEVPPEVMQMIGAIRSAGGAG